MPRITEGAEPKHAQLRAELARMAATDLAPDSAIPSERELMETYAVSRATVRRAIEPLVAEGVLRRVQGKGTFVAATPRAVPPPPRLVHAGHAPPWEDSDDARRPGRGGRTAGGRRRLVRPRARGRRPGGSSACASRRASPWRSRRGGTPPASCPTSAATTSASPSTSCSPGSTAWPWTPRSRPCAPRPPTTTSPATSTSTVGDPVMAFDRSSRSGGAPLERVLSHYRGDRYELHISLDSTMPQEPHDTYQERERR